MKPIAFRISAVSGSESTSISSLSGFDSTAVDVPFVGLDGGIGDLEGGGCRCEPRGPEGGSLGGGLLDLVRLDDRGGVRVLVLVLA